MKTYDEIVKGYKKRQHDTVMDTIATGLTYVDEIALDAGILEETGILTELTESASGLLPFVIISISEGSKVLLGKKPGKTGLKDGTYRMVKTGAALGVGAAVTGAAGFWAAIPITMGVRALFDLYRSKTMTGYRVQGRINRLRELNRHIRQAEETSSGESDDNAAAVIPAEFMIG